MSRLNDDFCTGSSRGTSRHTFSGSKSPSWPPTKGRRHGHELTLGDSRARVLWPLAEHVELARGRQADKSQRCARRQANQAPLIWQHLWKPADQYQLATLCASSCGAHLSARVGCGQIIEAIVIVGLSLLLPTTATATTPSPSSWPPRRPSRIIKLSS